MRQSKKMVCTLKTTREELHDLHQKAADGVVQRLQRESRSSMTRPNPTRVRDNVVSLLALGGSSKESGRTIDIPSLADNSGKARTAHVMSDAVGTRLQGNGRQSSARR